jgi:hypothetical protein
VPEVANNSEEDQFENNRMEKSKQNKEFLTPNLDTIPLIDLSGSESKLIFVNIYYFI